MWALVLLVAAQVGGDGQAPVKDSARESARDSARDSAKGLVDEIQVKDLDESITLRADGTAEYRFRGRPNNFISDERVGFFTAKLDRRHFIRVAAMLRNADGDTNLANFKDFYLPYSSHIVWLTLKRGDFSKSIEINERHGLNDPEPPDRLWTMEMAARGVATQLKWEPIGTGIKVKFKGLSEPLREIKVREVESHFPVVSLRSHKELVELPIKPGKYYVETSLFPEPPGTSPRKTPAIVEEGYLELVIGE